MPVTEVDYNLGWLYDTASYGSGSTASSITDYFVSISGKNRYQTNAQTGGFLTKFQSFTIKSLVLLANGVSDPIDVRDLLELRRGFFGFFLVSTPYPDWGQIRFILGGPDINPTVVRAISSAGTAQMVGIAGRGDLNNVLTFGGEAFLIQVTSERTYHAELHWPTTPTVAQDIDLTIALFGRATRPT